ncbi:MAG: hypothetical protein CL927_05285 [Deltaproteobacteria bacterium]|nr:hypothetical protein [Deltaproteobacteria bacterium]HCH66372.1 hypothetical protein [Deltaproteobacteria bacterium]
MTVLAILVFVRRLSGPLSQLVDAARRVQVGELDVDLPSPSSDEIGELTVAMEEMVRGLRERETIRDAFGRYVTQEVAEQVLSDPAAMRLGGVRRCVTILMSDLRGFTARSNQLEPEALVQLLNEYLGEMTASIVLHNGLIVEFIGDAILVLFGATGSSDDDALRACQCALDMHRRLDQMNTQLVARGTPRLQMGIGIHTGDVVVGNIGSEHRIKFGVVGDTVNTTARVESQTVGGQIFVSANTRQAVNADLSFGEAISTRVKGLAEPLWIHELQRADAAVDLVRLPFLHDHAVAHLYRIENKVVSEAFSPVDLTWDPSHGLQARSSDALQPLDDIMLVVWQEDGSRGHQLYCKVREVSGDGPYQNTLAVTAVTPTADTESDEALAVNSPSDTNDG